MGKLINQRRHVAHAASLGELPETARPPGPGYPMGGTETKALANARYRSLQGEGATASLRERPTDSLRVIPAEEFVGMGRWVIEIDEHVAVRYPGCDAVGVDTRHARICPRAGATNQHEPLVHAMSRTLKRLGTPHQVESGKPSTTDRNLRMNIVVRRGGLRDGPFREYREKSIPLDVTHADPQAQIHLRGGSTDLDGSAAFTSEAGKRQHYVRPGRVSCDERSHKLASFAVKSFGRLGVEGGKFIDQLAASSSGGRDGGSMGRKGLMGRNTYFKSSL